MQSNPPDDQLLRSYLLGELSEEEAERIEPRLLEDDELFLLCEAIEADLLAALDRGELTPTEKERVLERLTSSTQGRQRLALARFLNTAADRRFATKWWALPWVLIRRAFGSLSPGMRWATMVAVILLPAADVWIALENRNSLQQIASQISMPTPPWPVKKPAPLPINASVTEESPTTEGTPRPQIKPPAPVKAVLALSLIRLRGAEILETVSVPPGTDVVEIQIDLEGLEDVRSFRAAVRSKAEEETVWEKGSLKPQWLDESRVLVLEIPAARLPSGRYEVAVTGTEELTQDFEVVRENR